MVRRGFGLGQGRSEAQTGREFPGTTFLFLPTTEMGPIPPQKPPVRHEIVNTHPSTLHRPRPKMDMEQHDLVSLDPEQSFWDRFYMIAPLIVIGTRNEEEDSYDLAPKHMAAPMGWDNYFGFVCTPRHKTYRNAVRTGTYTVSFPKPSQIVLASLAASPRTGPPEGPRQKPSLDQMNTIAAETIDGVFLKDAYLFLECELDRRVDDLGENSLLIGEVTAVHVQEEVLRVSDQDDGEMIRENPLLAYLHPDRYATIDETNAFPFPAGFEK